MRRRSGRRARHPALQPPAGVLEPRQRRLQAQPQSGDPARYPGEIVEKDLVSGAVDVAFVWGPIAGYFAKNSSARLAVVPFEPSPEIQFDFRIAMGVRFGEREWKERIERLLEANRGPIQAILAAYGVPQLDEEGRLVQIK